MKMHSKPWKPEASGPPAWTRRNVSKALSLQLVDMTTGLYGAYALRVAAPTAAMGKVAAERSVAAIL